MSDDTPWLHIYAQYAWHDEAEIEGTRTALTAVRDAIDRALSAGMDAEATAFAADGEGYDVVVRVRSREHLEASGLPYTADYARQQRKRP